MKTKPKIKIKNCGNNTSLNSFFLDDVLEAVENRMLYMADNSTSKKKKKKNKKKSGGDR